MLDVVDSGFWIFLILEPEAWNLLFGFWNLIPETRNFFKLPEH